MSRDDALRVHVKKLICARSIDGFDVADLERRADELDGSLDAALDLVRSLSSARRRSDWPYHEPDGLEDIHDASAPLRSLGKIQDVPLGEASARVESAFLGSVCGCILGKPVEFNPSLATLEALFRAVGEWPICNYVSEKLRPGTEAHLGWSMSYWNRTYREHIQFVMPDDDLNYSILGMLLLEAWGTGLTTDYVRQAWGMHLPISSTFGPERSTLGYLALEGELPEPFTTLLTGGDPRGVRHCGAQIRADAYGYACPGNPALAADLAFQDASLTHRGSGLYATMWTAAAIAVAQTAPVDPLDIFRVANQYVPQESRFLEAVARGLSLVESATDWRSGYEAIHAELGGCGGSHCAVFEESATLINTLKFARRVDDGICMQVMQGNDTDSYGATAGSLLGAYFGPGLLDHERWIAPFNDTLHTSLAWFYESSLSAVAKRMGDLPRRLAQGETSGHTNR